MAIIIRDPLFVNPWRRSPNLRLPTSNRTWVFNGTIYIPVVAAPIPPQYEWPLPPVAPFPTSGRSTYNNIVLVLPPAAVAALVPQYEYPLPPQAAFPISSRTWINQVIRI